MKLIQLTQGQYAIVDDENYEYLNQWKWYAYFDNKTWYARRTDRISGKIKTIMMHRQVLNVKETKICIDHKDHNGLNNTKENLRKCSSAENSRNVTGRSKTSKYLGVIFRKRNLTRTRVDGSIHQFTRKFWMAQITCNSKKYHLGEHKTEVEAAIAYNNAAKKYFGEFANLNIIEENVIA